MKKTAKDRYNFSGRIWKPSATDDFFTLQYCDNSDIDLVLKYAVSDGDFKGNAKKLYYCDLPFSFDIETTSFSRETNGKEEKLATMYVWQFGVNGYVFIGREWSQFMELIEMITARLQLNINRRVLVYVHNLSFEFQFIRKMFEWENVFSIEERRPLYAVSKSGIEFRCSYLLSGYNLATVAKNLVKYKIKKLVGDLDYKLLRHSKTTLTSAEIEYCVNDVKIVMLYIKEYISNVKNIHSIPLTKTGAVRNFCRKNCFFVELDNGKKVNNWNYKHEIKSLKIANLDEFKALQRAFCGGFTHANANYVSREICNVASYDFTSSYPAVMVAELFPISRGVRINVENKKQFLQLLAKYHCVFDIEMFDVYTNNNYENYISVSKCVLKEKAVENNGRLVCAKRIIMTITEIDFAIINQMYTFSDYRVGYCYVYTKGYLPTPFVKSILQLYKKKTELKGVDGMETEYLNSKEMLNSCYGMCVTSPLQEETIYNNDIWSTKTLSENEKAQMLLKYNLSEKRFLYYIWGIYVTAYARRNLFTAITELKDDYIYSDTDSVKFINYEKHTDYFNDYNKAITRKLQKACEFHSIDFSTCNPQTNKGKFKLLGAWDFEGVYKRFKTLGAKRYMVEEENALNVDGKSYDFSLTVSGVNKRKAIPYLLDKYGKNGIFAAFSNNLYIPPFASGKNLVTYIDYETNGIITDYLGFAANFSELSSVNLSESEYNLSLAAQYIQYLCGLKEFKR